MDEVSTEKIANALKSMLVLNEQVNFLLDGYLSFVENVELLNPQVSMVTEQLRTANTSVRELADLMTVIKKMVIFISDGVPIRNNKALRQHITSELVLHIDLIFYLLTQYEIRPDEYSAMKVGGALLTIEEMFTHFCDN